MLLGIVILIVCVYLAGRAIQDARSRAWTGPRTPAMRHRSAKGKPARSPGRAAAKAAKSAGYVVAHPGSGQIRAQAKADVHRAWQETFATDWLEERRHARQNGTAAAGTATAAPPKRILRQRLKLAPFATSRPGRANGNGQPANGTQPAARGNGGPPARPVPPPPSQPARPASTNGGNPVSAGTSTASAEKPSRASTRSTPTPRRRHPRQARGGQVRPRGPRPVRRDADDAGPADVRAGRELRPGDHRAGRPGRAALRPARCPPPRPTRR